jgi:acetate kinase
MRVLTVNAGSSSLKFKIFDLVTEATVLLSGEISNLNDTAPSIFKLYDTNQTKIQHEEVKIDTTPYDEALTLLLNCPEFKKIKLSHIINRIVHGGEYTDIVKLDDSILDGLSRFNDVVPLHQPYNILIASKLLNLYPSLAHYACFDTSFHHTIPLINRIYALPWRYTTEHGIRKYGFHGLSYSYINSQLENAVGAKRSKDKWIIAHLGSGSSICAIANNKSVATTMGFSSLDGLPMMTRCGELDPQLPLYLKLKFDLSIDEVLRILNKESGLYGICQIKDMQEMLKSTDTNAILAVDFFCKQVAAYIAKLGVHLDGLNGIVFTGGIGENSPIIREKICNHLKWLGVELDNKVNHEQLSLISKKDSKVTVLTIKTNEELAMVSALAKYK